MFSMGAFTVSTLIAGFATNAMYLDIFGGLMGLWYVFFSFSFFPSFYSMQRWAEAIT